MARLRDQIQYAGAVIVYLRDFQPTQVITPAESDFETQLGLRRLATTRDGYMFAKL
jgi:hypothetical protein